MPHHFPRCQIIALADHQTSIQIDGVERLRWHYGSQYTRPFFFPFIGPTGSSLTRIGHPGASAQKFRETRFEAKAVLPKLKW